MKTLIKWPGGKTREFKYIKALIPSFNRYIEPFFGGGAVFFQLQPKTAIINDICTELMDFYRFLKTKNNREKFKREMYKYVDNWEKIPKFLSLFEKDLVQLYKKFKQNKVNEAEIENSIREMLNEDEKIFNELFLKDFCLDRQNLLAQIEKNLISKIKRTKKVEEKRGNLPNGDLHKNIETAFRSGFYMHFRDVMNFNGNKYQTSRAKTIANYYFIREFCYGSMFRFNNKGHFNIPYGGIAYNKKDFRKKVDYIFSSKIEELFSNTIIRNVDFEKIFHEYEYTKNDFFFLDPPYDTNFSDYEQESFSKHDQERLAQCLYDTKANFILIIQRTPFIYNLYKERKGIKIDSFEKKYLYNVKGRNNRDAEHLIIYNF